MVIMALDHVRDILHIDSINQSPTDLSTTTPILFFTRWVTHLCAPIFVFLAGSSAYLSFKRKSNLKESKKFFLKRGFWLILLEFTIVNLGLFFDAGFHTFIFEVIATIGFGFVIISFCLFWSTKTIGIIGITILFLHNLVPVIPLNSVSIAKIILSSLFDVGSVQIFSNRVFIMGYPPVPWLGIMMVGFASGRFFELTSEIRRSLFLKLGFATILLFLIVRGINIYGDPSPWEHEKTGIFTVLSFMNITKYPPSLSFTLITLGIMFLMLSFSEREYRFTFFFSVYGKVPLFYFVIHFYIIHCLLIIILLFQGIHWPDMTFISGTFGRPKGIKTGISLSAVYMVWIILVLFLYFPCRNFGRYKLTHRSWWLKYI